MLIHTKVANFKKLLAKMKSAKVMRITIYNHRKQNQQDEY